MTRKTSDEAEIRKLINDREKAVRARDLDGSIANIAPDIVLFDVVNPLHQIGSDALRERAEQWFASFEGPIDYEIRNLSVTAGNDVAFSHGLNHVSATKLGGGQLDMWWRTTVCFRKIDDQWTVVHEHNSVPFEVESGKASLDLTP
jgi:uncharacterized protein (TIGR02246 family)